jgi:flagellar secretion chaperone FliS
MQSQARNQYQQSEILDADPKRLVVLLYRAALDAMAKAQQHLASGEIRERADQISRAFEIVAVLAEAVNTEKGGEISANLLRLYDFVQQQLIQANLEQKPEPLAHAEWTLRNLLGAWEEIAAKPAPAPALVSSPVQATAARRPFSVSA